MNRIFSILRETATFIRKHINALISNLQQKFSNLKLSLETNLEIEGGLQKLLIYAASIVAVVYLASILIFSTLVSDADTKFGVFGDFVGGTLNPILSFLAFTGVLTTIALQRRELSYSRAELKRSADALEAQIKATEQQKFENSFFNMLSALDRIVEGVDLYNKKSEATQTGRDCFKTFYTRLSKIYKKNRAEYPQGNENELVANAFQKFWRDHQLELSAYFRFLYNIIRYIDESAQSEAHHIRLLRSQLSDQELLIIFYNCLTPAGSKMKPFAEKYALFDNLPTLRLLNGNHIELFSVEAFGSNQMHHGKNTGMTKISGPRAIHADRKSANHIEKKKKS